MGVVPSIVSPTAAIVTVPWGFSGGSSGAVVPVSVVSWELPPPAAA